MNKEPFECLIVDNIDIPLQKYPHIGHKIALLWGTQECLNYMFQLLTNQDRAPRDEVKGFDEGTVEAIMELIKKHPPEAEITKYHKGHRMWDPTAPMPL